MQDFLVQEAREARTAVATDFDFELPKFFAWAKAHAAADRKAKRWLHTSPVRSVQATGGAPKSVVATKRRMRPVRVSA
jgi:hypothetical protein